MIKALRSFTFVLFLAPFTSSCKLRDEGSQLRGAPTAAISAKSERAFATCAPSGSQGGWNVEVYQDITSERAQLKYWQINASATEGKPSDAIWASGVWENADERSAFERLYVFGGLSMIITLDRTSTGFYPATMTGKTSSGESLEQSLMCVF